ncbi:hypothetical protein RLOatenuis_2450 [Rickettsiales bacterium]|nr:hypothetical protein RLOatenuis_2450 [Rickettsiales bacterium]
MKYPKTTTQPPKESPIYLEPADSPNNLTNDQKIENQKTNQVCPACELVQNHSPAFVEIHKLGALNVLTRMAEWSDEQKATHRFLYLYLDKTKLCYNDKLIREALQEDPSLHSYRIKELESSTDITNTSTHPPTLPRGESVLPVDSRSIV